MYVDYSAETTPGTYYGDFWTWPQVPAMRTFIFPWTLEMTEYLEREYGLVEGGPYRCELLPVLWSRDGDAAGQVR